MAKGEFRFKHFLIRQDRCAMKVCTDSCIFGATIFVGDHVKNILDVGGGTGILSLMLAQRSMAFIDAIEIDENAAAQCAENVAESPWKDRIRVHPLSLQKFELIYSKKYDLIISNPPFFKNNLPSSDVAYNLACHSEELSLEELILISQRMLNADGTIVVMLPPFESTLLETLANDNGLFLKYSDVIRDKPDAKVLRKINYFSFRKGNETALESKQGEIIIRGKDGKYTEQFEKLLKHYYTIF